MKKYLFIFLALFWTMPFVYAQKTESTETRPLPTFTKLKSSSSFDVILVQGNEESAKIVAKNLSLTDVITEVRGGELHLELANNKYRYNFQVKLEITFQRLESVKLAGSGSIRCESPIKSENLTIKLSGSGDLYLSNLEATRTNITLSGSGNMKLSGKTAEQSMDLAGSGNYRGADLRALRTQVRLAGSGNISVNASEELVAKLTGSGNIRYSGNPKSKDIDKVGSGNINSAD